MSTFQFPSTGGEATRLSFAGRTSVTGSATIADNGDLIEVTVPAAGVGLNMGTLSTAPDQLIWDTGLTVGDIIHQPLGLRLTGPTLPSGNGANVVLAHGFGFATTAAFNAASDGSIWNELICGRLAEANTRSRHAGRVDNASTGIGGQLDNPTQSTLFAVPASDGAIGNFNVVAEAASPLFRSNARNSSITLTHKVLAFMFIGRSRDSAYSVDAAASVDVSFGLELLPNPASWSVA